MIITRTICLDASEVEEAIISYLLGKKHLKIDNDSTFAIVTYAGEVGNEVVDVMAEVVVRPPEQPEAKTVPASKVLE